MLLRICPFYWLLCCSYCGYTQIHALGALSAAISVLYRKQLFPQRNFCIICCLLRAPNPCTPFLLFTCENGFCEKTCVCVCIYLKPTKIYDFFSFFPERSEPPTPHYNSSALGDLLPRAHLQFLSAVSSQCSAFTDGVALLKVWLHQRELDQVGSLQWPIRLILFTLCTYRSETSCLYCSFNVLQGTGCFNGFLASMLMAYLLTTHRISNTMTAYQLLRNSLNFLGKEKKMTKLHTEMYDSDLLNFAFHWLKCVAVYSRLV